LKELNSHGEYNCDTFLSDQKKSKNKKKSKEKYLKYKIKYMQLKNLLKNGKL
jgi:hypothetical protein